MLISNCNSSLNTLLNQIFSVNSEHVFHEFMVRTAAHVSSGHIFTESDVDRRTFAVNTQHSAQSLLYLMGKSRTRRRGVKYRAQKLLLQYRFVPACSESIAVKDHYDQKYEQLFAAHNTSVTEFKRREGYYPRKPWPFTLVALILEPFPGIHPSDPRCTAYSIRRTPPTAVSTPYYI